jgi:aspartate racemase
MSAWAFSEPQGVWGCNPPAEAASILERAGAECLALCANTLHWFAADVERTVSIPLVHIASATAAAVRGQGFTKIGFLGTRPTMERDFYKTRPRAAGIESLVTDEADRSFVHDAIMDDLVREIFRPEVKARFLGIIAGLQRAGAQGIVLGCTEIPLLLGPGDTEVPLFDTLRIHASAIGGHALAP